VNSGCVMYISNGSFYTNDVEDRLYTHVLSV